MKRKGYVLQEIIDYSNVAEAFDYKISGKVARTRRGMWFLEHREEVIAQIQQELSDGSWTPGDYYERIINERGKQRRIQSVTLIKAIALNAVMRVVERCLTPSFITTTAASIKGRGMLYLFNLVKRDRRRNPEGTHIVRVDDIVKFYENIPQDLVMDTLRRKFKDARLLTILERCVTMMKQGLSIGLRPSQALANLFLSVFCDHRMKDLYGIPYYYRYCDDTRILSGSMYESTMITRALYGNVEKTGLAMKNIGQCYDIKNRPIDFLGYKLFHNNKVMIRKATKKRFAIRWKRVKSVRRRRELAGSFYGIAKHANAKHLFRTITGFDMKNFSEMGFRYVSSNGKKVFDEPLYPLSELQNRTIVVEDFESGITTREGEDRYVVKFGSDDIGNGKFITACDELKQALNFAREKNEIPFRTTIKRVSFGKGKSKYQFT